MISQRDIYAFRNYSGFLALLQDVKPITNYPLPITSPDKYDNRINPPAIFTKS